eukprot:scaffold2253_cov119-Cylindrotheca_fusiformis.AAC.13
MFFTRLRCCEFSRVYDFTRAIELYILPSSHTNMKIFKSQQAKVEDAAPSRARKPFRRHFSRSKTIPPAKASEVPEGFEKVPRNSQPLEQTQPREVHSILSAIRIQVEESYDDEATYSTINLPDDEKEDATLASTSSAFTDVSSLQGDVTVVTAEHCDPLQSSHMSSLHCGTVMGRLVGSSIRSTMNAPEEEEGAWEAMISDFFLV